MSQKPAPIAERFSAQSGIAIGPILFVLAMLAVLAAVMASGGSDFQVASGADRITADIAAQANLIRSTINQCNMQYVLAVSTNPGMTPSSDPYPCSDTSNGSLVSLLTCSPMVASPTCPPVSPATDGTTSLWGAILLPPPTSGFNPWTYIDASASGGGRCFWTTPTAGNPSGSESITTGLAHAASKFNATATYSATGEVIYSPSGSTNPTQKFVVWITLPTGTPDSHCTP